MHVIRSLSTAALLLVCTAALARQAPVKWGDVPRDVLAWTDFPPDSNAAAVVLCDYGDVTFDSRFRVNFDRHTRIKLLDPSAYEDWGSVSIPYYADRVKVSKIAGQTFNLKPDGRMEKTKLDKKSIFREKIAEGYEEVRFALPALQPGSVVEYRYRITYDHPVMMPDWAFQGSEPTLVSEFRAAFPSVLDYVFLSQGYQTFDVDESESYASSGVEGVRRRWVMHDVPALREEPYMTTTADFVAKIRFQLSTVVVNGWPQSVLGDWATVAEELMKSSDFGGQIGRYKELRRQAEAVVATLDQPTETDKVKAIYDYVRTTIAWNGWYGYFPNEDLKSAFEDLQADAPGMTLMLISMLNDVGLEANPVLISTRTNGRVTQLYPLLDQFNYLLAHVEADGTTYLLDPTDADRPYTMLPFRALSGTGWLVERDGGHRWISVGTSARYEHSAMIQATLDPDGTVRGTFSWADGGYSALSGRAHLKEADDDEAFVREAYLDDRQDFELGAVDIRHREDIEEKLATKVEFTLPQAAQVAGDFIYLNPKLIGQMEENPLKLEQRAFPVDFGYPSTTIYTILLTLPEGYSMAESPAPHRLGLPDGSGRATRVVQVADSVLTLKTVFVRNRAVYEPRHYEDLRALYDRLVAADAEQLVLRRTPVAQQP